MGVIMKNKVNYTGGGGSGGASALADLEDVELTTPTDGQALVYDTENDLWINGNVSGGTLVIQNASIYSEEEQQVGVWIDGKPLYQKSFIFSNISTLTGNQSYQTDLSNVGEAFLEGEIIEGVNRYAIPWAGNSGYALGFFFSTSTNYIWTKGTDTFSNATLKITVKYTKTTDVAGSGGYKAYGLSPIIYSEEEREVGVWTDGKPLYQKTINFGALPNNTTKSVAHGIQNADFINPINVFAFYPNAQYNTSIPALSLYNVANGIVVNVSDTNIDITARTDVSAYTNCYVTLQYTKTTDTAGSGIWTTTGEYAHHYSTNEKVVGTWIDGKPLYECTVSSGLSWAAKSSASSSLAANLAIPNVDLITHMELLPIPLVSTNQHVQGIRNSSFEMTVGDINTTATSINILVISRPANLSWLGASDVLFTVQYTKTTD